MDNNDSMENSEQAMKEKSFFFRWKSNKKTATTMTIDIKNHPLAKQPEYWEIVLLSGIAICSINGITNNILSQLLILYSKETASRSLVKFNA